MAASSHELLHKSRGGNELTVIVRPKLALLRHEHKKQQGGRDTRQKKFPSWQPWKGKAECEGEAEQGRHHILGDHAAVSDDCSRKAHQRQTQKAQHEGQLMNWCACGAFTP